MTPGLPDPAGIEEARTLGGNTQHNGALWFRGLPYTVSKLGTTHVGKWGGRSRPREKPRSTRNQFVIFCIFLCLFQTRENLYIKGREVCQLPWLPHVGLFHMGGRPTMATPVPPSGPHVAHGGKPFFLFPFNSFPLMGL